MANVILEFPPGAASFPTANFAAPTIAQGTNFPVPALAFDPSTDESAYFAFRAINYASGNLTVDVEWYADTGSSGTVIWGAALAAITPDTDSQDVETKAFGTAATVTDTHLGTVGQRLHRATITVTSLDSLAADDHCVLRVYRNATDTMAGDSLLVKVVVSYLST